MADFTINTPQQIIPASSAGATNFDAILSQIQNSTEQLVQQLTQNLGQQNLSSNALTQQNANTFQLQTPQLANFLSNSQTVLLKTLFPVTTNNFSLQFESSNIVNNQGQPTLKLEGQVVPSQPPSTTSQQLTSQTPAPTPQKFTIEIPVSNLAGQSGAPSTSQAASASQAVPASQFENLDQIVNNTIPQEVLPAIADNLSENIRPLLPQTLNNINLATQNNLSVKIVSFTTPDGQTVNVDLSPASTPVQAAAIANATIPSAEITAPTLPQNNIPQPQIISGQVEVFPEANESLVTTDFGTLRIQNLTNLPTGSTINFTIQGPAQTPQATNTNSIIDLNPTNLQTLKLALESLDSPLNNILKLITATQTAPNPVVTTLFPNPEEKQAHLQSLFFFSASAKGTPDEWLGSAAGALSKISSADNNPVKLKEMFITLQNFANKGPVTQNAEWNNYVIPFFDGSKLSYVTIQVQRDQEGSGGNQNSKQKTQIHP